MACATVTIVTCWLSSVLLGFQRWQRHTLLQFSACVLAGANCKCVWL